MAVSVRWPDDQGQWLVTAHWAKVAGRAIVVGLDVRSFRDIDLGGGTSLREPISDDLAEVTQEVIRSVGISKIREWTRRRLIENALWVSSIQVEDDDPSREQLSEARDWAAGRFVALTAKGEPRKRHPSPSDDLLRKVAELYQRAEAQGDKAPNKYIERVLREAGEPLLSIASASDLVRKWTHRARQRGYLPPKGEI